MLRVSPDTWTMQRKNILTESLELKNKYLKLEIDLIGLTSN